MHAMPPRITRNSDRPRASNRTMVDTQIPGPLAKFKTRLASSPPEDESHGYGKQAQRTSRANRGAHSQAVGWISRQKIFSASGRGGNFFLDIPFYRTSLFIELIEQSKTLPEQLPTRAFELSRWRGGRYACDTPDIMGCRSVLNRLSPLLLTRYPSAGCRRKSIQFP